MYRYNAMLYLVFKQKNKNKKHAHAAIAPYLLLMLVAKRSSSYTSGRNRLANGRRRAGWLPDSSNSASAVWPVPLPPPPPPPPPPPASTSPCESTPAAAARRCRRSYGREWGARRGAVPADWYLCRMYPPYSQIGRSILHFSHTSCFSHEPKNIFGSFNYQNKLRVVYLFIYTVSKRVVQLLLSLFVVNQLASYIKNSRRRIKKKRRKKDNVLSLLLLVLIRKTYQARRYGGITGGHSK